MSKYTIELIHSLFERIGKLEDDVKFLKSRGQKMRVEDLAKYVGVVKGTVYNWVHLNLIPYHLDGRPFFLKEEIDEWTRNGGVRGARRGLQDKADRDIAKHNQPKAA